ncbi:MAG: citrate/2-methylcitrate synthase [Anaerolineae bacterium]
MTSHKQLTASQLADMLDVHPVTLALYLRQGILAPVAVTEHDISLYPPITLENLVRTAPPVNVTCEPPLRSALTALNDAGVPHYRGHDVRQLATDQTFEAVASLLWQDDLVGGQALFDRELPISAQHYETMLLHAEIDGAQLSPLQELLTVLPAIASDDLDRHARDLPQLSLVGAHLLRLLASVVAGDVPDNLPIAEMLRLGWDVKSPHASDVFNSALILSADHTSDATTLAVRVTASTDADLYAVVMSGLLAVDNRGFTAMEVLFDVLTLHGALDALLDDVERHQLDLPGFVPRAEADARASILWQVLSAHFSQYPQWDGVQALLEQAQARLNLVPTLPLMLVATEYILLLPKDSARVLFGLGRTAGWIAHAIEQYGQPQRLSVQMDYSGRAPHTNS